jgi:hypothetical protein
MTDFDPQAIAGPRRCSTGISGAVEATDPDGKTAIFEAQTGTCLLSPM